MSTLNDKSPLLAFGAHPDDVEFGCGAILIREARGGRHVHVVVCSRGEAGTRGTPAQRAREARAAAAILGASVEFLTLDGDARLEVKAKHAFRLAAILRRVRPAFVLAPGTHVNQHPDHARLGTLVRDAARLARYGGIRDLKGRPHAIDHLLFYDLAGVAGQPNSPEILVDVSAVVETWRAAMEAHASQMKLRNYVELQLTQARLNGLRAGVEYAQALHPNDPLLVDSLAQLGRGARQF